jgi:hypothetical protein
MDHASLDRKISHFQGIISETGGKNHLFIEKSLILFGNEMEGQMSSREGELKPNSRCTISLRFLGIILSILRLEVSVWIS